MNRFSKGVCVVAILVSACGRSDDSWRIAKLESRLSELEDRIREEQATGDRVVDAIRTQMLARIVDSAPAVPAESGGYLDGTGMSFGSTFDWQTRKVLAEGAASISGKIMADGRPRAGIKLRLFLSGIRSAWTTSDAAGQYVVKVPPGRYNFQGFELDHAVADRELPGMLLRRDRDCLQPHPVDAAVDTPGLGPDFFFATAVMQLSPMGRASVPRNRVRLVWKAYPGAKDYEVRLMESAGPGLGAHSLAMNDPSLRTVNTFLVIPDRIPLSAGKLYTWMVTAYDTEGDEISHSPDARRQAAFVVK